MSKNILFIMCDQLRADYLGCMGHPTLKTPNIDKLAQRGVLFKNTYVQSPVCGASRMSFYTGRYVSSHGATWNGVPLKIGELTLGDHLRKLGVQSVLVGKTHMVADAEGLERLSIPKDSVIGVRHSECGFDAFEREDGLFCNGPNGSYLPQNAKYKAYLNEKGYKSDNPWHDYANSALVENKLASGWAMENADKPARIANEDSETPYITSRAIEFLEQAGDAPWCLHLSYIKPHWPYIAPAPYHTLYGVKDILPANKHERERNNPHPVFGAFQDHRVGKVFAKEEVREKVIPAYMGLIAQIDDELGRLFKYLEDKGLDKETMIVFTSDHGDYLGDHWLGEKDLFHDCSVKIPLIVVDPSAQADATRGSVSEALIESIDLVPTFVAYMGGNAASLSHILEGRSLLPLLQGQPQQWRDYAISEYDYGALKASVTLNKDPVEARLFMVANKDYKLMHALGFPPMLFDLKQDPEELHDQGQNPAYEAVRQELFGVLHAWGLRQSQRTTRSENQIKAGRGRSFEAGVLIGVYQENEIDERFWEKYRG